MTIEQLIGSYGPAAVLLGCFLEGETAAIVGGIFAHRGPTGTDVLWRWAAMAGMAGAGAFLADQMWFLIGRHAPDRGPVHRLRQHARTSAFGQRLNRARSLSAFLFRFVPGARIAGPLLLAQTPMPWPVFALLNASAVVIWSLAFTTLGFLFGQAVETALGRLAAHHWLWLVLAVAILGVALHRWLRSLRT